MQTLLRLLLLVAMTGLVAYPQAGGSEGAAFYEELIRSPIVPDRSTDEIKADLQRAEEDKKRADRAINDAQARQKQASEWVKQHKVEIKASKDKVKAAKKDKRESDVVQLQADRKQLELVEDYLKTFTGLRKTEVNQGKAMKSVADAERQAFSAELDLQNKFGTWMKSPADSPGYVEAALQAVDAAEKTLRLMEKMAAARADLADRGKRLASTRVKLVVARNKLVTEDRIRSAGEALTAER